MTIYLDTCALNRLTDDLSSPRVRREAQAVAQILDLVDAGKLLFLSSTVLEYEIS
jgi:hypothetical protein